MESERERSVDWQVDAEMGPFVGRRGGIKGGRRE